MAIGATIFVKFHNKADVLKYLDGLSPEKNETIMNKTLEDIAKQIARVAASEKIIRSGKKGVVHPTMLTNRTTTLVGSIEGTGIFAGKNIDKSDLPHGIAVGTVVEYAPFHEFDGVGKNATVRPFLKPALEDVIPKFQSVFLKYWNLYS